MDHPVSVTGEQTWRTTALVASAIAGFELFLLVVLFFVFFGRPVVHQIEEHATTKAPVATHAAKAKPETKTAVPAARKVEKPSLSRHETSIMVLNGNGVSGAASQESASLHSLGYMIAGTGNAPRTDFRHTMVMYRPGYEPEAKRLARDLHGIRVGPLDGVTAQDLGGAHLALILGGDAVDRG